MSERSQQTPACQTKVVSTGCVQVAHSWQHTQLAAHLAKLVSVQYSEGLGVADFLVPPNVAVLFVSEADLLTGTTYKRRVVKLRQSSASPQGVVLAQSTPITSHQFSQLQKLVCIELGLTIVPVQTVEEAGQLLAQMVTCQRKINNNPFRVKRSVASNPDASLIHSASLIPGLGEKKSRLVLQKLGSLQGVAGARREELEQVLGPATATIVYDFFHRHVS